jgi:heme/copper-type cytochrome/quinol oxidase subunit 2
MVVATAAGAGLLTLAACGSTSESKSSPLNFGFGPAQGVVSAGPIEMAAQSITIEILPPQDTKGGMNEVTMPANFAVQPGSPVKVVIHNYTNDVHTFAAPELGVNTPVAPASGSSPSVTTFTFTPKTYGVFEWHCVHCGTHMAGKVYAFIGYAPAKKA